MQIDLFGATEESATREAAPPVVSGSGAWVLPEAVAFNAALHAGSLVDAVAILNRLKTGVVSRVLLASGFTVGPTDSREKVIAFVQSDILAAARLRMTGTELRMARLVEKSGQSGSESLRPPVVSGFDLPPVVQVENPVALEKVRITKGVAANMKAGMRVVDGEGKEYQAFSARFAYLEAFPIGADGKPQVFAGNSVFFHLDPTTADLYPASRHDPIYLVGEISVDIPLKVVDTTSINNAITSGVEKEIEHGTVGESGSLRAGTGAQDHEDGGNRDSDSKPLDVGLAGTGRSAAEGGDVPRSADGAVEQGIGYSVGRTESAAHDESGNLADARGDGIPASGGRNGLTVGSARKLTREELNAMLVTEMTDDQLLQAKTLFRGDRREGAIERQIAKRAIVQEPVEEYSIVPGGDGKFTLENDEGIIGGNGDGSPRKFASAQVASDWASENGFGVVPSAPTIPLDNYLPEGWTESSPGRLATNRDPVVGGIVDTEMVSGKWFAIPENESIKKLVGFNSRSEVFAALQTEISALQNPLPKNPGMVKLPATVNDALVADVSGQKARMMRLQRMAKQSGVTLAQRVTLQAQAGLAEVALRQMRLAVFDAEDDAEKAIATGNVASFSARSVMFPGAFAAIKSHVASLQSSVEMASGDWDSLTGEEKTETLKRSGWVTGDGDLNFVGKRLLTTAWGGIVEGSKATIRKNLPAVAAKPAEVVQDFSNASLTADQLTGKISQFSMMRDDVSKTLRGGGLSASSQQNLREKLASRQNIIDAAQAELDGRAALVRSEGAPADVVHSLKASTDVQLIAAGNLLSKLTNGSGDIYALAGRDSVQLRVQVMAVLLGKDKVTQAEAGVTAMRAEFYKRTGIAGGQTSRDAELEFQKWVGSLAGQEVSVGVPVASLGEGAVLSVAEPRSDYPFGKTDVEHRFHNSRVRVIPELKGDVAWDGTVMSALNGGRLISVKRDGSDYGSIRISGNRIEVLSVVDAEAAVELDGAMSVPKSVRDSVQWALGQLRDVESALDGVQRARGNGHILSLEVAEQAVKLVRPREILAEFRKHAGDNKVDADAFIGELGGEPDLARFGEAKSIEKPDAKMSIGDGKAPWEMTANVFRQQRVGNAHFDQSYPGQDDSAYLKDAFAAHEKIVQEAVSNGENVPSDVLAEYPDLKPAAQRGKNGDALSSVQESTSRGEAFTIDFGSVVGVVPYRASSPAQAQVPEGYLVLSSEIIQRKTKLSVADAEIYPLLDNKIIWRVSAVKNKNGGLYSMTEVMDADYGRTLAGEVVAYFKEVKGHDLDILERIAPSVHKAAVVAWERAVQADEPSMFDEVGVAEAQPSKNVDALSSVGAPVDYVLTDADRLGLGGLGEKFQDNLRAIQIVRTLEVEKRHAVGDELRSLARYVGWGGLKGVFDPNNKQWNRQHVALRSLLSDAEWAAASRSMLDAFYTAPVVAKAMYSAVSRLGFEHGRVLEPSVGVGNFFGLMPEGMRQNSVLHGVELDVLTSQIVAALYPSAKIAKATGFQNYNVPSGYFDMAIGNPPFGSQAVSDDKGSVYSGWSIHNYFFAKSIDMLRPGGIMPMVVSHNFLDKLDPHVRQWIARRAELVSGVRLPNSAFKENANTEVVTDVLIFKRLDFENSLGKTELPDWLDTTDVEIENPKTGEVEKVAINNYFINNPQNVLGVNSTTGSMYRANEYTVSANGELDVQLADWVETLPKGIYVPLERSIKDIEAAAMAVEIPDFVKEGSFFLQDGVILERLQDQGGEQCTSKWEAPNQRAFERMSGMIEIRDVLRHQMRLERSIEDGDIEAGRRNLNKIYDGFVKKNGLLNDQLNRRLFLADTESSLIQALEFDYEKAISPAKAEEYGVEPRASRAVKADIFSRRVLFPPGEIEVVQTAKDALLHSLNNTGGVDMEFMQAAYGKDEQEIIAELGDLLFVDPVEGLVTADQYLSGDVKTKLVEATKAAQKDFSLSRNVDALAKVIPVDKLPSEIHAAIGAAWIPPQIFMDFAKEISGLNVKFSYVAATAQWLQTSLGVPDFAKNSNEYGTIKMGASTIFGMAMNSHAPEIKMKVIVDGEERWVTDEESTEAVRQRADKIRSHWDSWLWADGDRAEKLTSIYNDKFNRSVERKYDGSHLSFPGMSPSMSLLGHQKNGVWRGLQDRVMLMDQVVGAGKTYEGVAMMMEMRRLGICKKPLIAVPNHLTLQWRSEFYKLYPGANVLAATPQDFDKENRERFFSKIVTGNWDAVIVGHSSLKKIAVPLEAEMKIITEQFDDIADAILELKQSRGDRNVIRDMEKIKENLEAKMTRLREKGGKKDNVVDFADLGVDGLFIDELHEFKNLYFTTQMTRVAGLGNPAGSGKAFDLFTKIRWLQETFGETAPLIGATGTPISNSLAEMFTMQRYMQYSSLKANHLHVFDAWAKQYGDVQNVYEVAPSGSGYRLSQRFAKFKNLGSLMGQYRSFADVITLDHLKAQEAALGKTFPVPKLEGGKPLNIIAMRSELQEKFFGIPEIVRGEDGGIQFEVNLNLPTRIVKAEDGKFVLQQDDVTDQGAEFKRHGAKRYDTEEEAAYLTALASITPVMVVDSNSIVGQFNNLQALTRATKGKINALSLTSLANKAGLDYRLIDPNAVDFHDSKVNIAVRNMLETAKVWEADKGVQLVFCDLSVPLSAKAKMASKEKRVYVRDDKGALTHKKGTLHSAKGHDGLPYFLVQEGKGNLKTFTMYDPVTGHVLKNGLDSKSDAHDFAKRSLADVPGQERWLETREKSLAIGADEIDEYKNEHTLDADGDAADLEISLQDIEGSTGVAGFSIYDDMKSKLIVGGIPANQIEFIHDHDTPQAKDLLFKRVNAGDVRFLFGSTPKMGAGTNVQALLVALHHIDAPWRPSDLEQREGRIIRRGNRLYERDPEGFRIQVNRYATAQTYDTRRWQLLEHKASGLEQLRNYSGVNEMDDVANEASNSADMKAAASGNPLILKETQLATEMKKLQLLERAHRDTNYTMRSRLNTNRNYAERLGPIELSTWETLKVQRDTSQILGIYGSKKLTDKEQVMAAVDDINVQISKLSATKVLVYRGLKFELGCDEGSKFKKMTLPDGTSRLMEEISRSGVITRMDNWIYEIDLSIDYIIKRIERSKMEVDTMENNMGGAFEQAGDLVAAIAEHGKVQRALMKSNALSAVKPQDAEEFKIAVELQKSKLRQYGFGVAVSEIESSDGLEREPKVDAQPGEPDLLGVSAALLSVAELPQVAAGVDAEKAFFYVNGERGMTSHGSFTKDQARWMTFTRDEASLMQEKNIKPYGATTRGVFVGTVAGGRLKIAKPVTPQVPSGDMELFIKVAADSIGELRKTDVYRVLVESNRSEFRQAIASYIKAERPDLVREVDDVMDEARAEVLAKQNGVQAVSSLGSAANEPCVEIDHIKTRMVDALSVDLPDGWIVMNAPRPLLGTKTAEGDFVTGRFYAAIDPKDSMAKKYIEENIKLDARLLVVVSRDTQMEVAMHGNEYRDRYMEREAEERYEWLSSPLEKLRNIPYGELSKLILEAKGVVNEGLHIGQVLEVANGVVTQKINRSGETVCHDASRLSSVVGIGDVVDVQYRGGQGVVTGAGKAVAVGR